MGEKLKPCPFCGKTPEIREYDLAGGGTQYCIECMNLKCPQQPSTEHLIFTEDDAILAWNTRSEL